MRLVYVRLIPLLYIAYTLALTMLSLEGFPQNMHDGDVFPYLSERPISEDAYYMLTIAWNMGNGHGPVYNYETPSTGIQPLSTILYAIFAWFVQKVGGEIWLFLRLILLVTGLELLILGHLIGRIAYNLTPLHVKNDAYFFGLLGTVYNFSLFRLFTYGLETGIYLILLASCALYSLKFFKEKPSLRMAIIFGILGGLTIWARIDFGIIFFAFLGLLVVKNTLKLHLAIITWIFAILTSSPWFIYVFSVSNRWLPSSGSAQSGIVTMENALSRLKLMGRALLEHLTPWFYFEVRHEILTVAAICSFIAFLIFLITKKQVFKNIISQKDYSLTLNWLIAISILIIIYLIMFRATHFYMRYSSPIVIPIIVAMAILISKRVAESKLLFFTITTIFITAFFGWAYLSLHTGRIGVSFPVSAGFIQQHYPEKKVGAFQSGVIGFFNPNVINLDGKVNQAALDYTLQNNIHQYIDNEKIEILIDWQGVIYSRIKDTQWLAQNWEQCSFQFANDVQKTLCLQRKTIPNTKP